MVVIYCFDAYCGWCYGFSSQMLQLHNAYKSVVDFDVLSGGMIPDQNPRHIGVMADYINSAYPRVEALSGVQFGSDYLWHIKNPQESDWFPESTTPAIALCIFKEYLPKEAMPIAADLQHALHYEGRDLTDKEAYRHLLPRYGISEDAFYNKLKDPSYREKAYYEFALVKQLQVTGFPSVLVQTGELKFYLLAQGFTPYDTLSERLENILKESGRI